MILGLITSWSKTHCYFRIRPMGWDVVVADRWEALKKRWALQGQAQVIWLSVLHV
jgi:hypothetical protein